MNQFAHQFLFAAPRNGAGLSVSSQRPRASSGPATHNQSRFGPACGKGRLSVPITCRKSFVERTQFKLTFLLSSLIFISCAINFLVKVTSNRLSYFLSFGCFWLIAISCDIKPQPLNYGTDSCHACKMTLMDKKFGAEIVTKKGKVYKFDDLNCMVNFYNSGSEPDDNMAYKLVIDFANPGQFIDASQNYYVKSDSIRSPMASGVAAFSNEKDFKGYKKKWKGILLSWSELTTEFK